MAPKRIRRLCHSNWRMSIWGQFWGKIIFILDIYIVKTGEGTTLPSFLKFGSHLQIESSEIKILQFLSVQSPNWQNHLKTLKAKITTSFFVIFFRKFNFEKKWPKITFFIQINSFMTIAMKFENVAISVLLLYHGLKFQTICYLVLKTLLHSRGIIIKNQVVQLRLELISHIN
jgi:hypothetical protein